jgi:disulfide bond formation protein DsbB
VDAPQVAEVEAVLVTAGGVAIVALVVLRLTAKARFGAVRSWFAGSGLAVGGLVAVLATAASLWYSEVADFPPCDLCWYQRIAMYPLAVLLPVAALRRDLGMRFYAAVLAGIGLTVSIWHNVVETFPGRAPSSGCDPANPCTVRWVEAFGFWTIPRMAAVCFAVIVAALLLDRPTREAA